MLPKQKKSICVASDDELSVPSYYARLWLAIRNLPINRRDWLDEIADAIRDYDGEIFNAFGLPYLVPDIDETFGNDPDMRWFGYYLASDNTGECPKSQSRKLERVRLLDLYCKIRFPEIAKHFGK